MTVGGLDWFGIVYYNSSGTPTDNDFRACPVGITCNDSGYYAGAYFGTPTPPITVKIYDIGFPFPLNENTIPGLNFTLAGTFLASATGASAAGSVTWFNPGDGRINGHPGDRIAVWCNAAATPPNVVIYGVGDNATNASHGFLLGKFGYADLLKAGAKGILLNAGAGNGTISLQTDGKGNFYAAWNGGIFSATGQGDFAKSFACTFG